MSLLNVLVFLFGVAVTGIAFSVYKKYKKWIEERAEQELINIRTEQEGWIKTNDIYYWSDRQGMESWIKRIKKQQEIEDWIIQNTEDNFRMVTYNGIRYIKFDKEEDNIAFKLRWR